MNILNKTITVLGSTGSVGTQTLEVAEHLGLRVAALAAGKNVPLVEEQIRKFRPDVVAMSDKSAAEDLKIRVADLPVRVMSGQEAVCDVAAYDKSDIVLNSVTGLAGLLPTLSAIEAGKNIAIANKEPLVAAGNIVMSAASSKGVSVYPVDSEHSAIFQCIRAASHKEVSKIILTASGGPFFGKDKKYLSSVTKEEALCHPTWKMGKKITVDCATLMNKGLEIIEAMHLFGVSADNIEVVIHRESVIHSLVEFCDNGVLAQLGVPSMKLPIQYALTYPDRVVSDERKLSLTDYGSLSFYKPDYDTFMCLAACREAARRGGVAPAVVNGVNEVAVALFLEDRISFAEIGECVFESLNGIPTVENPSLEDVLDADREARIKTAEKYKG